MHRLAVPLMLLFLTACPQNASEVEDARTGTTQAVTGEDSLLAQPERGSMWVGSGWVARTPNGRACVFVPKTAVTGVAPGDSVRIEIERISPHERELPPSLPPAFAGRKVFAPMYEFTVYDSADQQVEQFADSVTFAMCVHYRESEAAAFENAALAHPDPDNPESLEILPVVDPPAACQLKCEPRGAAGPTQQVGSTSAGEAGGLLRPVPAYAAAAEETYFKGIGGKGSGTSPFAAVDTLAQGGEQGAAAD